jgi:hypothetical protein
MTQLRKLLDELAPTGVVEFDELNWLRLSRVFKVRGWQLVDEDGRRFDVVDVRGAERDELIAAMTG